MAQRATAMPPTHRFCACPASDSRGLPHPTQEQEQADQIAERIVQLGGATDFSPDRLTARSHAEYVEGKTLTDMIRENLVAERIAIESYREIAHYIGDKDPTTRRLMEEILATEEEHAYDSCR